MTLTATLDQTLDTPTRHAFRAAQEPRRTRTPDTADRRLTSRWIVDPAGRLTLSWMSVDEI